MINLLINQQQICHEHKSNEVGRPVGFPSPARDYAEDNLNLNSLMVKNPYSTYFVQMDGYSMIDAHILPKDILVVDRSLDATDGKVIIAVLNGELTVKRLQIRDNNYWLCSENTQFPNIKVEEWMGFEIWGVVSFVVHNCCN
jgi:DNA polymerase V